MENNEVRAELTVAGTGDDSRVMIENIMAYPSPVRFGTTDRRMKLSYVLNQDADVDVTVYTLFGEKIFGEEVPRGRTTVGCYCRVNDPSYWRR